MPEIFEQDLLHTPITASSGNVLIDRPVDTVAETTVSRRPTLLELQLIADGLVEADSKSPFVRRTAHTIRRAIQLIATFGNQPNNDIEVLPVDKTLCARGVQRFLTGARLEEVRAFHYTEPEPPYDLFDL